MPRNRKKLECVILGRLKQFLNDLKEEKAMQITLWLTPNQVRALETLKDLSGKKNLEETINSLFEMTQDKDLGKVQTYCEISDRVNALSETDRLKWRTCMAIINDPNTDADDRAMTINTMTEILK